MPNAELEPLGGKIPDEDPYDPTIPPPAGLRDFRYNGGDVFRPEYGCIVDGFLQDGPGLCTRMLDNGSAVQCPDNNCGPRAATYTDPTGGRHEFLTSPFQAFADGSSGYGIPNEILKLMNDHDWAAQVRAEGGFASVSGGGLAEGKEGDPCPLPQADGTVIQGITDKYGGCNPISIGTFDAGTTYDKGPFVIDWRSYEESNSYGSWTSMGRPTQATRQSSIDLKPVATVISACGAFANAGEYSTVANGMWRGPDGVWRTMKGIPTALGRGNRTFPVGRAAAFRVGGQMLFGIGSVISIAQYRNGEISGQKAVLDISMNAAGTFLGPWGFGANASYVVIDSSIGAGKFGRIMHDGMTGMHQGCQRPPRQWLTNRLGPG